MEKLLVQEGWVALPQAILGADIVNLLRDVAIQVVAHLVLVAAALNRYFELLFFHRRLELDV